MLVLLVPLAGHAGCDEAILWIDPPISLEGGAGGPASLIIGQRDPEEADAFVDLATDPALRVVHGLQGGTWTMPTLRIDGPPPSVEVDCRITTIGGEVVGVVATQARPSPLGDGRVDVPWLPIPVRHAPPRTTAPIDDLDGAGATITCEVAAGGGRARATYDVTLDVE
ncbi:MAG: hypothetical protein IT385_16285 [Deltaproteobacteria bacterium]|nr:hypothetical protein [Deltaproteobacteria bacterium]